MKKLTTEEFVQKAKAVHGDRYDYGKVDYASGREKILVTCLEHGEFLQKASSHLSGSGCYHCGRSETIGSRKVTELEFIERARSVHGDKYDYGDLRYKGTQGKARIVCPVHGEFFQRAADHLNGHGCVPCIAAPRVEWKKVPLEEFVSRSRLVHGDKYDYSKVRYNSINDKVVIVCPLHGDFSMSADKHSASGQGCRRCADIENGISQRRTIDEFLAMARKVHGDFYDYGKVEYAGNKRKVTIVCPVHGEFKQAPSNHWGGDGCPECKQSQGERLVADILNGLGLSYQVEKRFDDCRIVKTLPFDFFVEMDGAGYLIEFHGEQHYRPLRFFGGDRAFAKRQDNDKYKAEWAHDNNYKLIVIPYWMSREQIATLIKHSMKTR